MVRPHVHPADRSRAVKACVVCRSSKKKCDAQSPCGLCVKKGQPELCTYTTSRRGRERSSNASSHAAGSTRPAVSQIATSSGRASDSGAAASHQRLDELQCSTVRPASGSSNAATRDSTPHRGQRPTTLRSIRGEQVYIGNVAALSFLRFLQRTLKRYIGTSSFTDRHRHETMLEAEVYDDSAYIFSDDLSRGQKQELFKCFMSASCGILHLFSEDELSILLDNSRRPSINEGQSSPEQNRDSTACMYLVIAIGAQSRGRSSFDVQCARRYFAQAQQMAFYNMLQDPTLAMVRIFLLMAMYMLGACRRNAAFMYIGIASKAAMILGLHAPRQYRTISTEELSARHRTWTSLRILDLLCSAILARPSSTPSIEGSDYDIKSTDQNMDHRTLTISANYESSSIIDTIVRKFANDIALDVDAANNYLQTLQEWSHALPDTLRTSPITEGGLPPNAQIVETTIGNIHVACTYYFGVIIVTRQFLIARIMSQLHGGRKNASVANDKSDNPKSDQETQTQLSNACVSSAVFMVDLCHQALINKILLGNMFLLKAWLFSAGLVLGFSLLMDERDLTDIRKAFTQCREVLRHFAQSSPQAEQYYDILTNFSNAITLYQEQRSKEQQQNREMLVQKITSIGSSRSELTGSGSNSNQYVTMSKLPQQSMLQSPESSEIFNPFDDQNAAFSADYFAGQFEMPDFSMSADIGTGGLADLEWLRYATS